MNLIGLLAGLAKREGTKQLINHSLNNSESNEAVIRIFIETETFVRCSGLGEALHPPLTFTASSERPVQTGQMQQLFFFRRNNCSVKSISSMLEQCKR